MMQAALIVPAALCALGCIYFAAEAAHELRTRPARLNPSHAALAQFVALSAICFAGCAIALMPVLLLAIDAAIARGLAP